MKVEELRELKYIKGFIAVVAFLFAMMPQAFCVDGVDIQPVQTGRKQVSMVVTDTGRNDPFLPIFGGFDEEVSLVLDAPPDVPGLDNDALEVIKAKVTGIIYDKSNINSSAILNIGGKDYLTRIGDKVSGYEVTEISRNDITVKLGSNVFKAGVGQVISDEDLYDINKTQTPALESKFAGRRR